MEFNANKTIKNMRCPRGFRSSTTGIADHLLVGHEKASNRSGRPAYTLIELLLALGLSVVVVTAIAMAIQIYLVALAKQQAVVERKQVARSLLAMIENDLRAAIQYKANDYSGLDNLLQTQMLMMSGRASEEGEEAEPEPLHVEEDVAFRPTMLGSESVIMIDISRLPRLDQYNPLIASDEATVQSPSDVKSLAYFVSLTDGGVETSIEFAETKAPGGLYRREIDRAVAEFMGDTSLLSSPDNYTKLIAHEVAQISFRYWDGEAWQTEWDSAENGGFPVAIEVTLVIDSDRSTVASEGYSYSGVDGEMMQIYRTVVDLPVAEPTASDE
jgi:type II secretory pathway pseudopilin PulG